jgi:hypothetical protein
MWSVGKFICCHRNSNESRIVANFRSILLHRKKYRTTTVFIVIIMLEIRLIYNHEAYFIPTFHQQKFLQSSPTTKKAKIERGERKT